MSDLSDETARLDLIARILLGFVGLPMFVAGIIGNLLNSLVFAYRSQLNKLPTSVFLSISFITSQIDLIVNLLPQLVYQIGGTNLLTNSVILCKLRWFLGPVNGSVALYSICFAAINQYLITTRTVRLRHLITRRRAVVISFFILLLAIGLLGPNLIFYTHAVNPVNMTICSIINPAYAAYFVYFTTVMYSLIPIFVLSIFSVLTWRNLRSTLIRNRGLEQALTRMLLAQTVVVFLTITSTIINQMYFFYTRTTSKDSVRLAQESIVTSIFTLFGCSTQSFSFYVYILASKTFRQNIRCLFCPKQRRIQPVILMQGARQQQRIYTNLHLRV